MQRSIATVSLSGTLVEKLSAIRAAGFDGVEIFENDLLYFDGSPADVRRIAADLGLKIVLFQPFRDFEGVPPERLARNLERAKRKFDLMHELGTDRILVCSNVSPDTIGDESLLVDQLGALAHAARQAGVVVAYEALAWGRVVKTYGHAWRLVDAVDHPHLGLALDSFHTLSLDDSPDGIARIPGGRIAFVQIADAPKLAMDVLEWSRHYRSFPGQGDFDVAGFTARVIESGYDGPLSLEIFNDGFRAAPPALTAADGYRSLLYLEETTRTRLARDARQAPEASEAHEKRETRDADAPRARVFPKPSQSLFAPPPAPAHVGFQFIEFAVDAAAADNVAGWLGKLRFRRAGRHRSKDVTLYQHGAASIVMNAERDSFADAFFQEHGLSLCASAFRVDDARLAFERAAGYGYAPFSGRVGPNERVLQSVRAPDGSLNYFVDEAPGAPTLYESDFVLTDVDGPSEVGPLVGIDHVCLALPADALDTWVLFFKTAFGFEAERNWLVPDPYGLVRSRAVRSPDGSVRIALNASVDRHTAVVESLHRYRGTGLNHVAFRTGDIVAAIAEFAADGVPFLRIPRNYYDDLAARYALPDETIEVLSRHHLLYDRDETGGEFLHAYTELVDNRFSFEIVERRGGYDGYGAANAAVRLAAQTQRRK
ncbi:MULTISPECIES: bifunctional sugar phosphate isomerase/epimerase/4-hydroxyphenylpyruvate dioxygenase family protein [pseudomallei group]|uniref:bifunctional sugar phosphate isomerase/epimerase/4-hydroxyphenylpyruvate dioxygenase family protein n=1 Tax=pseudomallei group TaxID=111527 RepID=UPI00016A8043|nr:MULTISPECIES: sugar phosphate isomerase/epimerase and 4-hydroxyphenylpyruvate domain-containing protein [pseudomallei group]AJX35970.1 glyoxalase/Bleomycin resistance /Dioxygenase superfamily protein [Burkholderia oklahomensis C6786]AOI49719.1 4-hydroxyphenylpyruvate dioxygenase [Burkholderia oklahomensis C6786]ARK46236.1 4-hydroxyphenylpyruvate dioxygenase [Burkholderia pseudomallei]ARK56226.1 4-hydroxyphenylpyruvate dioxygenase [Burkholderia pseudomallei]KUY51837.1 4-hydroxyphenylpyruvate